MIKDPSQTIRELTHKRMNIDYIIVVHHLSANGKIKKLIKLKTYLFEVIFNLRSSDCYRSNKKFLFNCKPME